MFESPGSVGATAAGVRPRCRSTRWFAVLAALVGLVVAPAGAQTQVTDSSTTRGFGTPDLVGIGWRSVGPANMGGRVAAIAAVPGSRTSFYVGYGTGGVFKTDNLGVSFSPVFDKTGVQSIGAIEVADAPADWRGWTDEERKAAAPTAGKKGKAKNLPEPKNDLATRGKGKIVWVGTGEGNNRNSSSWGHGVYRSTDAGGSFQFVGLAETHDIPRLAVDPRDPDVCYVAAAGHLWGWNPERGIFKTRDGGKTWDHVLAIDDKTGACDVVIDPKQPNTVYAAMYARRRTPWSYTGTSEEGGIYRSDDAGRSWKKLTQGLPPRTGRIGLAVFLKDPHILYAVVESDWGGSGRDPFENRSPSGGLFRTEDRGEIWTRVNEASFRPFYFSRIAIDPENDQRIYIPGWDVGISDDGGRTIRRSSDNVHVDHHAIVVNPADPNEILIGCDGGLYISYDRAATWEYRNNVAVGQYYRVAVDDSDPYRIGGGLQDNGSWIGPSATLFETMDSSKDGILNSDWRMIFFGDGFGVAFDPTDPNRVYATSQGGYLARIRLDTNVMKMIRPSPKEGEERFRFNWNAPFIVSQHDPTVLYQGGNKLFRLEERGDRWFAMGGDLTRNEPNKTATVGSDAETFGTIVTIAESPVKRGLLWVGTDDGLVQVTADDGKSWTNVTPAAVDSMYVSRIVASRYDANTAYVAVDGHRSDVFRPLVLASRDLGRTWTEITGDLPAGGPVKSLLEDLENPDVLYCGTEFGCFVTLDRGQHWVRLNGTSMPPAPVDDIVMQPREHDLVVGTHGRSLYVLDDASMFAELRPEVRSQKLALLDIRPARPRLYAGRAYGTGNANFRAKNPPKGAIINFWVASDAGHRVALSIADSTGLVVRELSATASHGLNRVVWDLQADAKQRFVGFDESQLDQTQFVPAGTYTVTARLDDAKSEKKLRVLPAPNAPRPLSGP